jgi:hypothetical protein
MQKCSNRSSTERAGELPPHIAPCLIFIRFIGTELLAAENTGISPRSEIRRGGARMEIKLAYGVIGPAGMPQAVVARLNREINAILNVPETRDQLSKQGADPRTGTPEEFAAAMVNDTKKWQKVVAAAGIKPQ